jgi:hypothetical protein
MDIWVGCMDFIDFAFKLINPKFINIPKQKISLETPSSFKTGSSKN